MHVVQDSNELICWRFLATFWNERRMICIEKGKFPVVDLRTIDACLKGISFIIFVKVLLCIGCLQHFLSLVNDKQFIIIFCLCLPDASMRIIPFWRRVDREFSKLICVISNNRFFAWKIDPLSWGGEKVPSAIYCSKRSGVIEAEMRSLEEKKNFSLFLQITLADNINNQYLPCVTYWLAVGVPLLSLFANLADQRSL